MKYTREDAECFCREYLERPFVSYADATMEEINAGLFRMRRDGIVYEAMKELRDSGTDPVELLRAALEIVDSDAMVVVNRMPVSVPEPETKAAV